MDNKANIAPFIPVKEISDGNTDCINIIADKVSFLANNMYGMKIEYKIPENPDSLYGELAGQNEFMHQIVEILTEMCGRFA